MGQQYGLMVPGPVVGAINIMDWDGGQTDHVGIVESVNADGSWTNIEGNHLDKVARVPRSRASGTHWFVLPKYSSPAPPVPPKPKEVDEMYVPMDRVSDQGGLKVLVSPEAWWDIGAWVADCFVVLKNEGDKACTALIYTTPNSGEHKVVLGARTEATSRQAVNVKPFGVSGGQSITVKTDGPDLVAGVSIMATKK
jgi:hypothetical protein